MTMQLLLVQHGEACAKDVDPDRPLTDRGAADVDRLAAFLGDAGVRVGRVFVGGISPRNMRPACPTSQR